MKQSQKAKKLTKSTKNRKMKETVLVLMSCLNSFLFPSFLPFILLSFPFLFFYSLTCLLLYLCVYIPILYHLEFATATFCWYFSWCSKPVKSSRTLVSFCNKRMKKQNDDLFFYLLDNIRSLRGWKWNYNSWFWYCLGVKICEIMPFWKTSGIFYLFIPSFLTLEFPLLSLGIHHYFHR